MQALCQISMQPTLVDCDPGHDDAFALLLVLAAQERFDLKAVTTIAGNVGLEQVTANAIRILDLAQRPDIPVHAGCSVGLCGPLYGCVELVGTDGMEGADLPPPSRGTSPGHAVDAIRGMLRSSKTPVMIFGLGPLTNLACVLTLDPDLAMEKIFSIGIMGGAFGAGNAGGAEGEPRVAEYNVYADPVAASIVLGSGIPITIAPLDLTRQARVTVDVVGRVAALRGRVGRAMAGTLAYYDRPEMQTFADAGEGWPLHDPCVVAALLDPSLVSEELVGITVETGGANRGRTVAGSADANGIRLLTAIDRRGFFDLLCDRLERFA